MAFHYVWLGWLWLDVRVRHGQGRSQKEDVRASAKQRRKDDRREKYVRVLARLFAKERGGGETNICGATILALTIYTVSE